MVVYLLKSLIIYENILQPRQNMMNQGGAMMGAQGQLNPQQMQPQQALYDQVTEQNFGNPYDCPEGAYGGSMMSSVGYSKVRIFNSGI